MLNQSYLTIIIMLGGHININYLCLQNLLPHFDLTENKPNSQRRLVILSKKLN